MMRGSFCRPDAAARDLPWASFSPISALGFSRCIYLASILSLAASWAEFHHGDMVSILAALALINLVARQPFSAGYYIVLPISYIFTRCLIFSLSQPLLRIAKGEDLLLSFRSFQDRVFHSSRCPTPPHPPLATALSHLSRV